MKKIRLLWLAAAGLFVLPPGRAATFDDIQFWVGSGANQAALVLDWNDGKNAESLLWGYRWDGAATGLDMFQAVVNADSQLFAHLGTYSWGTATLGIGYDLNNSGDFGVSPSLTFDSRGLALDTNPDDARSATDAADHWLEGWNNGFWAYYLKSATGDAWASSLTGSADRALANGVWDGYSFSPGFVDSDPSEPIAATPVPEPGSFALLIAGVMFLVCARHQKS